MGICSPELGGQLPLGVVPRNTSVTRRSKKICGCLQSPLAGADDDEGPTGACPEGLLPGGDPAIRGEDASSWRLPEGPLRDEPNKLGWPHSGCGMKVVPLNLAMEVCLDSMVLLQLLEATTGMGYCRICCQPSLRCRCPGDYQQAPTETWSQIMARMPGQGVAASVGGPTTPGTATAEVQEQGVPPLPPGLHPPDFTNWSLPFPEAPPTGGLSTPSGGLPSIGRQTAGPWALGQKAPTPPMQVPSTPRECCQFIS